MKKYLKMMTLAVLVCVGLLCLPLQSGAKAAIKMNPGQTKQMTVPAGFKNMVWSSSRKSVAAVNKKGKVTAKSAGSAVITVKAGNKSEKYTVNVIKPQLSDTDMTLTVGETGNLTLKNAYGVVKWTSSSKAVNVSAAGKITAVKKGKAVVTASMFGKKYSCSVAVNETEDTKIQVIVGSQTFDAVLYNNEAAAALLKRFPMTVSMSELNGNEKYFYMPESLKQNANKPSQIHTGDIMLYGTDCLVLFYKDFTTSYSYTPLGYVTDTKGLADALGKGNVTVTFQKKQ